MIELEDLVYLQRLWTVWLVLVLQMLGKHFPCIPHPLQLCQCLDNNNNKNKNPTEHIYQDGSIQFLVLYMIRNLPALSTAASIATAPSLGAGTGARLLWKEPIGVLAALTITTSCQIPLRKTCDTFTYTFE